MKTNLQQWVSSLIVLTLTGCAAWQNGTQSHTPQAQHILLVGITEVRMQHGDLFVAGKGKALADDGKTKVDEKSLMSSYPLFEITIKSADAEALSACLSRLQEAQDAHTHIHLRGQGSFTIKSLIDPPLDTDVFHLSSLTSCGDEGTSSPAPATMAASMTTPLVAASTDTINQAVPMADLVAVPEKYVNQMTVVSGEIASVVHFDDPSSQVTIASEGQSMNSTFITGALPASERLALVHASLGTPVVVKGSLTKATHGFEFRIIDVISVRSAQP